MSRDRHEEALAILIKYHAEGDASSPFVAAEYHQIRETIRLEQEASRSPWKELVTNSVNRRRVLIAACVGLFAQWAGNGLVSVSAPSGASADPWPASHPQPSSPHSGIIANENLPLHSTT
jgi:anti-sigma factor RsiW